MKHFYNLMAIVAMLSVLFTGCRKDDIIPNEEEQLPSQTVTSVVGFYLLNQGNMNMNKASLDYYDYASGKYRSNVFGEANPEATLGLGDVGNNVGVYGSKLYAVINKSNKLEIMNAATSKRLKTIDIKNARYVTFAGSKAYVSAYGGGVDLGENSVNGFVVEIDTATMAITNKVEVGRQPEELAVVNNKLYVANSGGYSAPNYESTVSVIDLTSFTVTKKIEVAPNLERLRSDKYGDLYVSSRGDYDKIPSKLFVIDTGKGEVKKSFDVPTSNLTIVGDTAYIISTSFSMKTYEWEIDYHQIDIKKEEILKDSFLSKSVIKEIEMPYGIAVDPISKDIYITDVRDFASPGKLYFIDKKGDLKFTKGTGDVPVDIAFVYKTTKIEK